MKTYYVYIIASRSCVLYTGVTSDLQRRVVEHKQGSILGFTQRYHINRLVWYQEFNEVQAAIETEKRIKAWTRAKRVALIEEKNPRWEDLAFDWLEQHDR